MGNPPSPPGGPTNQPGGPPETSPEAVGYAPSLEHPLTGNRAVHFRTNQLEPPTYYYVTQDDFLGVQFMAGSGIAVPTTLYISGVILLPDGRLQMMQWPIAIAAANQYTPNTPQYFPLAEGFLITVTAWMPASSGVWQPGRVFVQVYLQKGQIVATNIQQQLLCGYVSFARFRCWPGDLMQDPFDGPGSLYDSFTSSNPTSTDFSLTVPAGAKWKVHSFYGKLATSSTVANRSVTLQFQSGVGVLWQDTCEFTQAASTTYQYTWGFETGSNQTAITGVNTVQRSLPDVPLFNGGTVNTSTNNLQTGDHWTAISVCYEEWLLQT